MQRALIKFFYIASFVIIIKILVNLRKLIQCKNFYNLYKDYLTKKDQKFLGYMPIIKKLFYEAKIKEPMITIMEPTGFGYVLSGQTSLFNNMQLLRKDVVTLTNICFQQAVTIFMQNIKDALNPFYWLDFIVFLPRHIAIYLDLSFPKAVIKIFQVIYWLIGFAYSVYSSEFNSFFKSLIGRLIK